MKGDLMANNTDNKYYCKICKKKTLVIKEIYNNIFEKRIWNKEMKTYLLDYSSFDEPDEVLCGICGNKLRELKYNKVTYNKDDMDIDIDYLAGFNMDKKTAKEFILSIIKQSNGKLTK